MHREHVNFWGAFSSHLSALIVPYALLCLCSLDLFPVHVVALGSRSPEGGKERTMSIYDIEVTTIEGQPHKMEAYHGKTLLIVNVASQCGYTPQYTGLQALYEQYRDKGLTVLGFPCDQFGHKEPG